MSVYKNYAYLNKLLLFIGSILFFASCTPDREEHHLYSATTNNDIVMYSNEAKADVYIEHVSGQTKYYYDITPNSGRSGVFLHAATYSDTQRHFTFPELKANYYDVLVGDPKTIKATMDITDISDGVISGTFSGVFVRSWIRYGMHYYCLDDTIRVTNGEFRITYCMSELD